MAEITASMVKALREETGQGMMECKKALQESNGDVEAAKDLLRKKGLVSAAKKSERATSEGLIRIATNGDKTSAAMVEVRCETDFCSRNDVFQKMVADVANMALKMANGKIEATAEITNAVQNAFNKIGENMGYARGIKISAGRVGAYLHHNGKVGVLVGIDGQISDETINDICMHIAFANPMALRKEDVPADLVEKEKKFAKQEAIDSGKPADIAEKMVAGKINKFLAANALLEQPFVRDEKQKVKDILGGAKITSFARFAVGTTD